MGFNGRSRSPSNWTLTLTRLLGLSLALALGGFVLLHISPARADALVADGLGFDTCEAPNTSQMATIQADYQQDFIGIYPPGGATAGCPSQPNLYPGWVSTEKAAGWDFILIWSDLQDPCWNGANSQAFSLTQSSAYSQGQTSAGNAEGEVSYLGYGPTAPIAADIEAYTGNTYWVNQYGLGACEAAALAYQAGWANELSALGYDTETYGSSSGSDIPQYAQGYPSSGQNIPQFIFFAEWDNNPNTSSAYIPSGEWIYNQRIKQYVANVTAPQPGGQILFPSGTFDGDCADATMSGNTAYSQPC
jgi:hypothetical protein